MDVVLVRWRIKPSAEQEFLDWWQSSLEERPEGLVEERLSKVEPDETSTWDLLDSSSVCYVSVGLWQDRSYWKKAFSGAPTLLPFESSLRERVWLSVKESR